jgi:hypothetical protein
VLGFASIEIFVRQAWQPILLISGYISRLASLLVTYSFENVGELSPNAHMRKVM